MRQVTVTARCNCGVTATGCTSDQYITPFQVTYSKTGSGTVQVNGDMTDTCSKWQLCFRYFYLDYCANSSPKHHNF